MNAIAAGKDCPTAPTRPVIGGLDESTADRIAAGVPIWPSSAAPRRCGKHRSLSVSCCWSPCDCAMSPRPRHAHATRHNTMEAAATHERFVSSVITRGAPQPQSHSVRELQRAIARGEIRENIGVSYFPPCMHYQASSVAACARLPRLLARHGGMVLCDLYQGRQLSSL